MGKIVGSGIAQQAGAAAWSPGAAAAGGGGGGDDGLLLAFLLQDANPGGGVSGLAVGNLRSSAESFVQGTVQLPAEVGGGGGGGVIGWSGFDRAGKSAPSVLHTVPASKQAAHATAFFVRR